MEDDLLTAIKNRDLSLLRHVLKHFPKQALNKNVANDSKGTRPWHYLKYDGIAASESVLREMVQLLHCAGADFNLTRAVPARYPNYQITILQELSISHHEQNNYVAKELVELGVDVNAIPNAECALREPPLSICLRFNIQLGKFLIEKSWADWTILFNTYAPIPQLFAPTYWVSLEKRIRRDLIYVALGLRALDFPVLCVLEIFDWIADQRYTSKPSAVTRWAIASKIKHFPIE